MKEFNDCLGLPLIALDISEELGNVTHFLLDPVEGRVVGLTAASKDWFTEQNALLFSDISAFGVDAVMVRAADALRPLSRLQEARPFLDCTEGMRGRRAVSSDGRNLGTIAAWAFNERTAEVEQYQLDPCDGGEPVRVDLSAFVRSGKAIVILAPNSILPTGGPAGPGRSASTNGFPPPADTNGSSGSGVGRHPSDFGVGPLSAGSRASEPSVVHTPTERLVEALQDDAPQPRFAEPETVPPQAVQPQAPAVPTPVAPLLDSTPVDTPEATGSAPNAPAPRKTTPRKTTTNDTTPSEIAPAFTVPGPEETAGSPVVEDAKVEDAKVEAAVTEEVAERHSVNGTEEPVYPTFEIAPLPAESRTMETIPSSASTPPVEEPPVAPADPAQDRPVANNLQEAINRNEDLMIPMIVGKYADRDLFDGQGVRLVARGQEITASVANSARQAWKLYDLWIAAKSTPPRES